MVDLGTSPPSNAYLAAPNLGAREAVFPLRVLVCRNCWLVQTEDFAGREELFDADYAYFSSFSKSWLDHSEKYVAQMVERFGLNTSSYVVEVAANDGYLLQYVAACGIPCVGIEPTAGTAAAARRRGIEIVEEFFGVDSGRRFAAAGKQADLTIGNNVLAHVPDINDFVAGFSYLLKANGVATFEFPHLIRLMAENQFDTIYHEHFSYISLTAATRIFSANGLAIFDVEECATHGGSLRIFAQRSDSGRHSRTERLDEMLDMERRLGVESPDYYASFQAKALKIKRDLVRFLSTTAGDGKSIGAYGAAAKGNTLLNYSGVGSDLVPWVVDANPAKQGKYLPGSHIPIVSEERIRREQPAFILILPWNLKNEIMEQLSYARAWGAKFVWAIPNLEVQ
jgi:SAM-dependent methyltransferase